MVWRTDSAALVTVNRYDFGTIGEVTRTPQGGLVVPSRPTKAGVLSYRQPDGSIRLEYRPPEEVFAPESLATLRNAPITDLHPEQGGVRIPVTTDNWRALTMGHVSTEVRQDGDHVSAPLLVQDQGMIAKILSKERRELSAGYSCQLDLTPGTAPDGQKYDVVQRKIVYNHVAVGPDGWGRAGPTVALRADSGDAEQVPTEPKDKAVETEIIDGVTYKVGSAEHLAKLRAMRDAATGRADAADKALKAAKEAPPDMAVINAAAQARANLLVICSRAAAYKRLTFDDKAAAATSSDDLVIQIIMMLDPTADVKGKSPDYLAGVLSTLAKGLNDAAPESVKPPPAPPGPAAGPPAAPGAPVTKTDDKGPGPLFKARQGAEPVKTDTKVDPDPDPDAARYDSDVAEKAMIKRNQERGTKPLGITKSR